MTDSVSTEKISLDSEAELLDYLDALERLALIDYKDDRRESLRQLRYMLSLIGFTEEKFNERLEDFKARGFSIKDSRKFENFVKVILFEALEDFTLRESKRWWELELGDL